MFLSLIGIFEFWALLSLWFNNLISKLILGLELRVLVSYWLVWWAFCCGLVCLIWWVFISCLLFDCSCWFWLVRFAGVLICMVCGFRKYCGLFVCLLLVWCLAVFVVRFDYLFVLVFVDLLFNVQVWLLRMFRCFVRCLCMWRLFVFVVIWFSVLLVWLFTNSVVLFLNFVGCVSVLNLLDGWFNVIC